MQVVDLDMEYYPILYNILTENMSEDRISILDVETKLLLDDTSLVGFFSGEVIGDGYNLHHFYTDSNKRNFTNACRLSNALFDCARQHGCKYLVLHALRDSREDQWIKCFGRRKNVTVLACLDNNYIIYRAEV